jgi:Na+/proline symporter
LQLSLLDWGIVAGSLATSVSIGVLAGRKSGESADEFFLSGRSMPWWLLGTSMVATTFSTDTPNLVTGLTRAHGVAGNWSWWAFLLTSMLTAFFFAPLWRRSGVTTDMEFYELRYSGVPAAFLRAFRGIYVGLLINVLIMGAVTLAAVKFGSVLFGFTPLETVAVAGTATVIFSAAGGLRGVLVSDLFLFVLAMTGSIAAAAVAVHQPAVGGLRGLFANPSVRNDVGFLPSFSDPEALVTLIVMPLLVQWWSVWYPGAEPGGGGFVAQRMLAAKDEKNSVGAILLFNVAHYALRPWPWILVALSSLIIFPDLASLRHAFPHVAPGVINQDFAYAAMLTFLPKGWLGIVTASLVAAYLSTTGTCLNLGSAYAVNDLYGRFLRPGAGEREKVMVGRLATVALMILAAAVALALRSAMQAFNIMLSVGAGTGLIFLLRWYWPRINAWSEISAMIVSFAVSMLVQFTPLAALPDWLKLSGAVLVTTASWVLVILVTPCTSDEVLREFYLRVRPPGRGWNRFARELGLAASHASGQSKAGAAFTCMICGCGLVYALLFAAGALLGGKVPLCIALASLGAGLGLVCYRYWDRAMRAEVGVTADTLSRGTMPRGGTQTHFAHVSHEVKGEGTL